LGCGWLGLPLSKNLISGGFTLKASTTSENKLHLLGNEGIKAYKVKLGENSIDGDIQGLLENSCMLIIDIPPKSGTGENFPDKIRQLNACLESSVVKKVIFISSTSVYPDNNNVAIEDTVLYPASESAKQLLEAEQVLVGNNNLETTIIRFGGLIADDRHPVFHLSGRHGIANPEAVINLIHRDDCIGIIRNVIENNIWGQTLNAVTPYHPTRKEYYTAKAIALQLPIPLFDNNLSVGKQVSSGKLLRLTGYSFIHPKL
jgi:nucleoside-diphosphate-sugar epimerase